MRLGTVFGISGLAWLNHVVSRELLAAHGWLARCAITTVLNLLRVFPQYFQRWSANANGHRRLVGEVSIMLVFNLISGVGFELTTFRL